MAVGHPHAPRAAHQTGSSTILDRYRHPDAHRHREGQPIWQPLHSQGPPAPPRRYNMAMHYGTLWQDPRTLGWSLRDQDGQMIQLDIGDRVNVGTLYGVRVDATLMPSVDGPVWAVTAIPAGPCNGALASIHVAQPTGDDTEGSPTWPGASLR